MIRFALAAFALASAALAAPALAQSSFQKADALALVIASEQPCGLAYAPEGVDAWIAANVAADDMEFAGDLGKLTRLHARNLSAMGETEKRAHCAQTARVAKAFGFTAE